VAFALQADGWILRSDIIWAKPNPMPESVTDRPTKAHEYLFLFAKSPRYYYDADAIAEVGLVADRPQRTYPNYSGKGNTDRNDDGRGDFIRDMRNKRTVWTVATQPFPGSHFAVYPPELIRPCIRAGSAIGDTVLDPFSGSGTTGAVATFEGRKYIGIDLNAEYLDLSLRTRFQQPTLNMEAS
jgi:DNA modification methylase